MGATSTSEAGLTPILARSFLLSRGIVPCVCVCVCVCMCMCMCVCVCVCVCVCMCMCAPDHIT